MNDINRLKHLAGVVAEDNGVPTPKFIVHVDRYDGTAEGVSIGDFMEMVNDTENDMLSHYEETSGSAGLSGAGSPYSKTVTYNGEEDMFILFY